MMARRVLLYLIGVVVLCFGVVLNTKTGLGVASINTIPFSISQIMGISLGTATFVLYCLFVVAQLLIRQRIILKVLMQLPVSLIFGVLVDIFDQRVLTFIADSAVASIVLLVCAIVLTALGSTLMVTVRLVPAAPDGIVQTLGDSFGMTFGSMKFRFDVVCIALTAAYSTLLVGHPVGIGAGTLAAMAFTGHLCNLWGLLLKKLKIYS